MASYETYLSSNWCVCFYFIAHYGDVIMGTMASQITSLIIVNSTFYSGADQSKQQSCASLAFVWGIHRGPVNSPHKWPVMRKMFPFDDVIMSQTIFSWDIANKIFHLAIKVNIMARVKMDGHIWGLAFNWRVCFSFQDNRKLNVWLWNFMAKIQVDGHIWSLTFNLYVLKLSVQYDFTPNKSPDLRSWDVKSIVACPFCFSIMW